LLKTTIRDGTKIIRIGHAMGRFKPFKTYANTRKIEIRFAISNSGETPYVYKSNLS